MVALLRQAFHVVLGGGPAWPGWRRCAAAWRCRRKSDWTSMRGCSSSTEGATAPAVYRELVGEDAAAVGRGPRLRFRQTRLHVRLRTRGHMAMLLGAVQ